MSCQLARTLTFIFTIVAVISLPGLAQAPQPNPIPSNQPKSFFLYTQFHILDGVWEGGWIETPATSIEMMSSPRKHETWLAISFAPTSDGLHRKSSHFKIKRVKTIFDNYFELPIEDRETAKYVQSFLSSAKGTLSLSEDALYIGSKSWANTRNGAEEADYQTFLQGLPQFGRRVVLIDSISEQHLVKAHLGSDEIFLYSKDPTKGPFSIGATLNKLRSNLNLDKLSHLRHQLTFAKRGSQDQQQLQAEVESLKRNELHYQAAVAALKRNKIKLSLRTHELETIEYLLKALTPKK